MHTLPTGEKSPTAPKVWPFGTLRVPEATYPLPPPIKTPQERSKPLPAPMWEDSAPF